MYHLFIATPEKVLFDAQVTSLIVPGSMGFFEVLANHAPIISTLKAGEVVVTDSNKKKLTWNLSQGYLEVNNNEATLLADGIVEKHH